VRPAMRRRSLPAPLAGGRLSAAIAAASDSRVTDDAEASFDGKKNPARAGCNSHKCTGPSRADCQYASGLSPRLNEPVPKMWDGRVNSRRESSRQAEKSIAY